MRNLQGKLTWVIARPLLLAIWLFLPLSATLCHAQSQPGPCWNAPYPYYEPPYLPRITSGFPSTAGEGYLVTIQSDPSEPYFSNNNDCLAWMVSYENFWINGRYIEDPNAGVSNLTYISPTEIQLNVALAGNASGYEVLAITDGFYTLFWNIDLQGSALNLAPCQQCQAQAGAPINVTNGNVWVQQRDYTVPGLGGGLGLVRTWNSLLGNTGSLGGMFGLYWVSTYEENLTGPDSNNYLTYWRGDGSSWLFYYNSSLNSYNLVSPPNVRAQLVSNPTGGFTLTLADGTQRVFNNQNLLSSIIDRNNNQTTIAYDSSNRITSVTSPGGSTLRFTYGNSNNPYQATTVQDSVGTVATYTYDSSSRLTLVSYPDGSALNFTYDPNSSMILSVTDSQGKLLEAHTYDSQNRGLTSTRANGVDSVSLVY